MPLGGARCNSSCARRWQAWQDQSGTDIRHGRRTKARCRLERNATAGRWRVVNRVRRCSSRGKRREETQRWQATHSTSSCRPARCSKGAPAMAKHKRLVQCERLPAHMFMRWHLTFDMRGSTRLAGACPLDGRVRRHSFHVARILSRKLRASSGPPLEYAAFSAWLQALQYDRFSRFP